MQVGNIRIIDNNYYHNDINEFLFFNYYKKKEKISKVKHLEKIISQMNENINVLGIHSEPFYDLIGKPNVLVDLTNKPSSKLNSLKLSDRLRIPLITASTSENKGKIMVYEPMNQVEKILLSKNNNSKTIEDYLFLDFENSKQGNIPNGLIGGLATEEIRKSILKLKPNDKLLKKAVTYNLLSNKRFEDKSDITLNFDCYLNEKDLFKDKKIVMIGAGAVGNFVGLGLSLLGINQIYMIDMDEVDATNPNRQILYNFENNIGKRKVDVLSKALKNINPNINIKGLYGKVGEYLNENERSQGVKLIGESELLKLNCDLIIGGVDTFTTRAFINKIAVKNKIPYIDAGTEPFSGQVSVYNPGKTACINCHKNVYLLAQKEAKENDITPTSCIADNHDPSVVMSNQIISAMIVGEVKKIFYPEVYGFTIRDSIYYNSLSANRIILGNHIRNPRKGCPCSQDFYKK